MTVNNTKRHTNYTQSNAQMHHGFVDDPRAEAWDSVGRYYPVETMVLRSNPYLGYGKLKKNENLDLFNRSKRKRKPMMNKVSHVKWYITQTQILNGSMFFMIGV